MWSIFPGLFRTFLGEVLRHLHFASDNLKGPIPLSFGKSSIQTLWLTSQTGDSRLNGTLTVLQNMSSLTQLWLEGNHFTGHLPDLSTLTRLEDLTLTGNQLTGIVSSSSVYLSKLIFISFADDIFQGSARRFNSKVNVDMAFGWTSSFRLKDSGFACDSHVNISLPIAESMGYPLVFAVEEETILAVPLSHGRGSYAMK